MAGYVVDASGGPWNCPTCQREAVRHEWLVPSGQDSGRSTQPPEDVIGSVFYHADGTEHVVSLE